MNFKKTLTDYDQRSLKAILEKVADYFKTTPEGILTDSREDQTCYWRFVVFHFAYYHFKISIGKIRAYYGFKQHGTIRNGLKRIGEWSEVSKDIRNDLEAIRANLQDVPTQTIIEQAKSA